MVGTGLRHDVRAVKPASADSFNTVALAIWRPYAVRVVGDDVHGNPVEFECGYFGLADAHEIDHLKGVLPLHRAERYRAITALLAPTTEETLSG